jgi:hypothetical protein
MREAKDDTQWEFISQAIALKGKRNVACGVIVTLTTAAIFGAGIHRIALT